MARPVKFKKGEVHLTHLLSDTMKYLDTQQLRILWQVVRYAEEHRRQHLEFFKEMDHAPAPYIPRDDIKFEKHITEFMSNEQRTIRGGSQDDMVFEAFDALTKRHISIRGRDSFAVGNFISSAYKDDGDSTVRFTVNRLVWAAALDYSKQFAMIDVAAAMQLQSQYSMMFFQKAKQYATTGWWNVSVEEFRKAFGCEDKYVDRIDNLKTRIIDSAKKELDERGTWSFDYVTDKKGTRSIKEFKFRFYEIQREVAVEVEQPQAEVKQANYAELDPEIVKVLQDRLSLSLRQIKNNSTTLREFQHLFGDRSITRILETLEWMQRTTKKRPKENVGLFIDNIKKKIEAAKEEQPKNLEGAKRMQGYSDAVVAALSAKTKKH